MVGGMTGVAGGGGKKICAKVSAFSQFSCAIVAALLAVMVEREGILVFE